MVYTGGPEQPRDQIIRILGPKGAPIADGVRLAVLNAVGLVAAMVIFVLVSLVTRVINHFTTLPFVFSGFATAVVVVGIALFFWYRYATLHGQRARARGQVVRADVYGAIAGIPFATVAAFLGVTATISLFFGLITFSGDRSLSALRQIVFAVFFLALALANIIIARAASD